MNELKPGEVLEMHEVYLGREKKLVPRLLIYKLTQEQTQERLAIRAKNEKKKGITYKDEQNRNYSFTYDGANRLTKLTNLYGYFVNYQLDEVGNVTSTTDSKNKTIGYTYGSDNRILSVTDPSGKVTTFHYDGSGRPFEVIRGNGVKSVQISDKEGRITEIANPGNPDGSSYYYNYDKNSNITAIYGFTG